MHRHWRIVAQCLDVISVGDVVVNCKTPPLRRFVDGNERIEESHGHVKYTSAFPFYPADYLEAAVAQAVIVPAPETNRTDSILNETYDCSQFGIYVPTLRGDPDATQQYLRKSPSRNCPAIMSRAIYDAAAGRNCCEASVNDHCSG